MTLSSSPKDHAKQINDVIKYGILEPSREVDYWLEVLDGKRSDTSGKSPCKECHDSLVSMRDGITELMVHLQSSYKKWPDVILIDGPPPPIPDGKLLVRVLVDSTSGYQARANVFTRICLSKNNR